jgi:hypothetical protein
MSNKIIYNTLRRAAFPVTLVLIGLVTAFSPLERTLGANVRLVYLHGAWVWTGKVAFAAAGLAGLAGLFAHRPAGHAWSRALGLTGMLFWITYLPLSLVVQQINWGGILWDEPRWKTALVIGIVGLLLQAGLTLISLPALTSAANLVFGAGVWLALAETPNVLHPNSPIASSGSLLIQVFFVVLLGLCVVAGGQVAGWLKEKLDPGQNTF